MDEEDLITGDEDPAVEPAVELDQPLAGLAEDAAEASGMIADPATSQHTTRTGKTVKRIDWPRLKREYVEGLPDPENVPDGRIWPSMDKIAERHGVAGTTVRQKGSDEGWREARAAFQTHVERVRMQKRAEAGAKELQDLDASALRVAKTGVGLASARLAQLSLAVRRSREAGGLENVIDARELNLLAQAADLFHRIGLRSLGDPEGTIRHELGAPGGGPIKIDAELRRDDPARLTGVLHVLALAGLGDTFGAEPDARALLDAPDPQDGRVDGGHPAIEARR